MICCRLCITKCITKEKYTKVLKGRIFEQNFFEDG